MRINLKETFLIKASPPEEGIWQGNPTNQQTLLALHSGNVAGVNLADGNRDGNTRGEKAEKERREDLYREMALIIHQQFLETMDHVREKIADARGYFQGKLNNLERDEAAFQADMILLPQGLEVYPDANDSNRYYYQDESGNWNELHDETFLKEAHDIHQEKGAVRTMQSKQAWDQYKDGVEKGNEAVNNAQIKTDEIEDKVKSGKMSPDEGRKQAEEIGENIKQLKSDIDNDFDVAFEGKVEFIGDQKELLKNDFQTTNKDIENRSGLENDFLDDNYDLTESGPSIPTPSP